VLAWFREFNFPVRAINVLWGRLCEQLSKELVKIIPDLKWCRLAVYFFDSLEHLEKAAFQEEELSGPNGDSM